jgi:hypothetical protein
LDPIGYIGCAASPTRVTRPRPQNDSGSRSTIGYSRISGVAVIRAGMSSQSNDQSAKCGSASANRPSRFQSGRLGGSPPPTITSATQLISARPPARRPIGYATNLTEVVLPAIARVEPDRNGASSAVPRQSITPLHRGDGSPGCSRARTAE